MEIDAVRRPEQRAAQGWDPWQALRRMPHVSLYVCRMPPGYRGATDGFRTIWLDEQMLQVEKRCALAHELIHVEWNHRRAPGPKIEAAVRRETAARLIPWSRLLDAVHPETPLSEIAAELGVTLAVLRDRLAGCDPARLRLLDLKAVWEGS